MKLEIDNYKIQPGDRVNISQIPCSYNGELTKEKAKKIFKSRIKDLKRLQELLYADHKKALLIVFQAMDAGGKDSTIRNVIGPLNPQGVHVHNFKAPTQEERDHDFLWRIHKAVPSRGYIGVFNRSHYEDVLIARVKNLAAPEIIEKRYSQINQFEEGLVEEGTRIIKFYLHISKAYQKERFLRRLNLPEKHWKFSEGDLAERQRWGEYQSAFNLALGRCSTAAAPWFVIPAETRWYRNLLVAEIICRQLEGMDLKYPETNIDPSKIVIPDY
ncbi:MAG: polyphosphate kinase 2 family protein [Spirochaetales bacterium]|nr:polyphosphate kinase 2 family protein [Spirochaetales bacterium]